MARRNQQVEITGRQRAGAMGPRHRRVHLRDHHPRALQRGDQQVVRKSQAVAALRVGRRHLQQHRVDLERAAQQGGHLRVGARQHLQHTGAGQLPVAAGAAIAEEVEAVGVLRQQRARAVDAQDQAQATERVALRHQGTGQGQRFGIGLAPEHRVAGQQPIGVVGIAGRDHGAHCRTTPRSASRPNVAASMPSTEDSTSSVCCPSRGAVCGATRSSAPNCSGNPGASVLPTPG